MYTTSVSMTRWGAIVAKARLLLQQEQTYQKRMAAMRKRLAFIAENQDCLPEADLDEAAELQAEFADSRLGVRQLDAANLHALEAASLCGIRS